MSMRMTITMSQRPMLVMTPKLQQAIKILQMQRLELAQYISQQMVENPVLEETYEELEETDSDNETEVENESDETEEEITELDMDLETGLPDPDVDAKPESDNQELDIAADDSGDMDWDDIDWEKYLGSDPVATKNEWEHRPDDEMRDNMATPSESLAEHLLWQLRMSVTCEEDYAIGEAIIGNIDEDGYLTSEISEIADLMECDVAEVERVLKLIQTFEPTGVGTRDLKECILMQLQQLDLEDTVAYEIVEKDYLEDLEANRFPQVAKALGVEMELVRAAADAIASLEPKPGRQFSSEKPEYVVPDVTVEKVEGDYRVFVNDYGPTIRLSPYYRGMLSSGGSISGEAREYIKSKIQSASWLMESIERRRRTIRRVTESIFEVQRGFLEQGPSQLKPLTLKDIADIVGVHEATVSRVTSGRYVQTPRGVFELKYFFNSSIPTGNGGSTSSASVKEMIKDMVGNEPPQSPLSDKEIETKLEENGIHIARRTIAKYRKELNIPSSSKRKKW